MTRLNVIFFKMVYSTLLPWIKIFGVNDVPPFPYGTKLWICAHASRLLTLLLSIYYRSYNVFWSTY